MRDRMNILAFATHASSVLSGPPLRSMLVLILHAGAIAWALHAPGGTASERLTVPVTLVAVMLAPPARPVAAEALPAPSRPQPPTVPAAPAAKQQPTLRQMPRQMPTAAVLASGSSSVAESAPAASAAPVSTAALAQHAAPVAAARFDADYLNNPEPVYPLMSRNRGESGKVLLLVQVTAQGTAAQVEIKQGCGFPRLDQAALNAVRNWRFVPARRGDEAVAASVVVPITFRLDS